MANRALWSVWLVVLSLGLAACGQGSQTIELEGTQWVLVEMAGQSPIDGRTITIGFEDGEVSGYLGCNSFSGPYSLRGERLEFGLLMTTLMACVEDELMQQESRLADLLGQVDRAQMVEGRLHLVLSDGGRLIYEPVD
jgi:heat shock protein HslJ